MRRVVRNAHTTQSNRDTNRTTTENRTYPPFGPSHEMSNESVVREQNAKTEENHGRFSSFGRRLFGWVCNGVNSLNRFYSTTASQRNQIESQRDSTVANSPSKRKHHGAFDLVMNQRQIYGKRFKSIRQIPSYVFKSIDQVGGRVMSLLLELERIKETPSITLARVTELLMELSECLCDDNPATESHRRAFLSYNGFSTLYSFLEYILDPTSRVESRVGFSKKLRTEIQLITLTIMHEILLLSKTSIDSLIVDKKRFITLLIALLLGDLFHVACSILELLVRSSSVFIDLTEYRPLASAIRIADTASLQRLCKVMALLVLPPDNYHQKLNQDHMPTTKSSNLKQLCSERIRISYRNQCYLLHLGGLLGRLVEILNTNWSWNHASIPPTIMDIIDRSEEFSIAPDEIIYDDPTTGIRRLSLHDLFLSSHKVAVLNLFSSLLRGPRKWDVQKILFRCGIVPVLRKIFDGSCWKGTSDNHDSPDFHGIGCNCSPDANAKIQVLQTIGDLLEIQGQTEEFYTYCLTADELSAAGAIPLPQHENRGCIGEKGLITAVMDCILNPETSSRYKIWMYAIIDKLLFKAPKFILRHVASSKMLKLLVENVTQDQYLEDDMSWSFDLLEAVLFHDEEVQHRFYSSAQGQEFAILGSRMCEYPTKSCIFIRRLALNSKIFRRDLTRLQPQHRCFEQLGSVLESKKESIMAELLHAAILDSSQSSIAHVTTTLLLWALHESDKETLLLNVIKILIEPLYPGSLHFQDTSTLISRLREWRIFYSVQVEEIVQLEQRYDIPVKTWQTWIHQFESVLQNLQPTQESLQHATDAAQ